MLSMPIQVQPHADVLPVANELINIFIENTYFPAIRFTKNPYISLRELRLFYIHLEF